MTETTSKEIHRALAMERMPTGVAGLDSLLGGGLIRGAIYLVMGRPGTGKTTLGNQLAFAHAAQGGKTAYVTLLAESHANLMKNLQPMRFFDSSVVNRDLFYVGAYRMLREDKLRGMLDLLRRVIEDDKVSLLLLDGISPARALAGDDLALKEFIVELQVLGAMLNCTTVLLANMTAEDANGPEHTMVDGLIELAFDRSRRSTRRTIEVLKFRGSAHLLGRHEATITEDGVTVYPRLEALVARDGKPPGSSSQRLSLGVRGLDELFGGGVLSGTTSVVLGFSGSGKTTLCLHFLAAGLEAGEAAIHVGFYEAPERILAQAKQFGIDLYRHERSGQFMQLWHSSYEFELDALATRLLREVDRVKARRVVIDGLDGLRQSATDPSRTLHYLTALCNALRSRDVTILITDETSKARGTEIEMRLDGTSALTENLIVLEHLTVGTQLRRLLSIVKQRSTSHASEVREFTIGARGIEIASDADSARLMLSNLHHRGGPVTGGYGSSSGA